MPTAHLRAPHRARRLIPAIGLGVLIAVTGCASSGDPSPAPAASSLAPIAPASAAAMDPVATAFVDAWNARDADAMAALFTDDAVLIDADRRFEGREQIRTGFAVPEVAGYSVQVLEVGERRADGQRLLVRVDRNSGGDFRASFDFTITDGRIPRADLQYA
ncbi:nuclear transport factor 2 family protein [Nocardia sp. NPDC058379]|uniref:nuclear transport factor 2 family protein n=1 Tax=unclassified Nocardia TaxID=2637762 RepID=UPI0036584019